MTYAIPSYAGPRAAGVNYWRLAIGCGMVASAALISLALRFLTTMTRLNIPSGAGRVIVLQFMPDLVGSGLVLAAAFVLAGVTPRSGWVKTALCVGVAALWLLVRAGNDLFNVTVYLSGSFWTEHREGVFTVMGVGFAVFFLLQDLLITLAGAYFIWLGMLIGQRVAGIIAAVTLVPCLLLTFLLAAYQTARAAGAMNGDLQRTFGQYYGFVYTANQVVILLVFGGMALFGAIMALRPRAA